MRTVARTGKFLATALQLGLLLLLIHAYQIEPGSGLLSLTGLIFAGFLIHAAIPMPYRAPFFLALCFAALVAVLGLSALLLIAIGLALAGTCHLPIAFRWRIMILVALGSTIVALRANWIPGAPEVFSGRMLPVLGSMFMFRTIIYLYDLRHEKVSASVWQRLSYFFLLPNACFLLFPVVDYKTFVRTYYQRDTIEIYQKGVHWILRGLTHLLLYRIVYYYLAPAPSAIAGLADVMLFLTSAWLLFLHVSGLFHLAIGILCLFGFDLPETNRLYFLASSPNEIWRRANIYWKDFMMKVFYYPVYKPLQKRLGLALSLIIATLGVFLATWGLHSYQWFWILGKFPFDAVDAAFWTIFAALVLANTLWALKPRKKRPLGADSWSPSGAVIHTLKIMGMFMLMSVMWSWWSTRDTGAWLSILSVAAGSSPRDFTLLGLAIVGILGAGVVIQYLIRRGGTWGFPGYRATYRQSAIVTSAAALTLLGASRPQVQHQAGPRTAAVLASLQTERLNDRDTEVQQRGYYESLVKTDQLALEISQPRVQQSRERKLLGSAEVTQFTSNELEYELIPSLELVFRGALLRTNSFGMRDKLYSLKKPEGTLRIALVGTSISMGAGVKDDETYEALVEERLNREHAGEKYSRYELLNFAVGGYSLLQQNLVVRDRIFRFEPDILLFATHPGETRRSTEVISREINQRMARGAALPPVLADIQRRAGIDSSTKRAEVRRRVRSGKFAVEVQSLVYREMVAECRRRNVIPVWLLVPTLADDDSDAGIADVARRAGFVVLSIAESYTGRNEAELTVSASDFHPNPSGHRLLAEQLYEELRKNDTVLGLGLSGARR
ncbi:MAG: SGNH/GDSL hydrolase family protein [Gemmatimonadaceae bacterium]